MSYFPPLENIISSGNSSTTPLGASGVFTGTGVDSLDNYISVTVSIDTDQSGTLDIQFSSNNTDWISTTYSVSTTFLKTINLGARYVRVLYTNDGTPQTYFRLQTILNSEKSTEEVQVTNTVTVSGTVNVGNTPNVSVTNTPNVSVTNTPNVSVTNTPNVSVTNTPNVSVTNTPTVDIDNYLDYIALESTNNTTTTPLSGSGTFTGTADTNNYPDVLVSCYADVAGTLYFDFSVNGTDWRTYPTNGFNIPAGQHRLHKAVKGPRQFRARFVNGATGQTTFQLYTYYGEFDQLTAPLNQAISLDNDAILTRATFPWLDTARGLVSNIETIEKFGYNEDVGTAWEPIAYGGIYQTPTSAVSLEFVSSAVGDALSGAGMHELTIEGLDTNWELQTTSVAAHATDGTVAVAIPGTWTRVFRCKVTQSGTYASATAGSHVGTITIRVASAGTTYAIIPLINSFPMSKTFIGSYTVPSGYTGYIKLKDVSADTGKTFNVAFFSRDNADDVSSSYTGTMEVIDFMTGLTGGELYSSSPNEVPHGPFVGPCDIGFMGYSSGGGGNAAVSVNFEVFLVQE